MPLSTRRCADVMRVRPTQRGPRHHRNAARATTGRTVRDGRRHLPIVSRPTSKRRTRISSSVHRRPEVSVKLLFTTRTILLGRHGSRVDRRLRFRRKSRSLSSPFGNDAPADAIVPGLRSPTVSAPHEHVVLGDEITKYPSNSLNRFRLFRRSARRFPPFFFSLVESALPAPLPINTAAGTAADLDRPSH